MKEKEEQVVWGKIWKADELTGSRRPRAVGDSLLNSGSPDQSLFVSQVLRRKAGKESENERGYNTCW